MALWSHTRFVIVGDTPLPLPETPLTPESDPPTPPFIVTWQRARPLCLCVGVCVCFFLFFLATIYKLTVWRVLVCQVVGLTSAPASIHLSWAISHWKTSAFTLSVNCLTMTQPHGFVSVLWFLIFRPRS